MLMLYVLDNLKSFSSFRITSTNYRTNLDYLATAIKMLVY